MGDPRAYAYRVLDLIERRALYADRVDRPVVRARLLAAADGAVAPSELQEHSTATRTTSSPTTWPPALGVA